MHIGLFTLYIKHILKAIKEQVFYGNWFYGVCAVALSIEASVQQFIPLNNLLYYIFVFAATVIYYSKAYLNTTVNVDSENERTSWYFKHQKSNKIKQWLLAFLLIIISFMMGNHIGNSWMHLSVIEYSVILFFPFVALGYYGFGYCFNLRTNGWSKPFVIGLVWAGVVTLYPVLFRSITNHDLFVLSLRCVILFVKNWMFIAMLCILFDIKDYAVDANQSLNTFVVQKGLRETIFKVVMPLTIAGFVVFIIYSFNSQFSMGRILINTIPFVALLFVSFKLISRKSLLYYLSIVDGLMLLKAVCGILGIILYK